jgi:hypothetical protein
VWIPVPVACGRLRSGCCGSHKAGRWNRSDLILSCASSHESNIIPAAAAVAFLAVPSAYNSWHKPTLKNFEVKKMEGGSATEGNEGNEASGFSSFPLRPSVRIASA